MFSHQDKASQQSERLVELDLDILSTTMFSHQDKASQQSERLTELDVATE